PLLPSCLQGGEASPLGSPCAARGQAVVRPHRGPRLPPQHCRTPGSRAPPAGSVACRLGRAVPALPGTSCYSDGAWLLHGRGTAATTLAARLAAPLPSTPCRFHPLPR